MVKKESKSKSQENPKPISIRFTCGANGEQVGLSHYLMTTARKQ